MSALRLFPRCFFFNDTATTEIYTLSLHDALPISHTGHAFIVICQPHKSKFRSCEEQIECIHRSEEHTSELQSQSNLVCRLLLEKKNNLTAYTNASCSRMEC